MRIDESILCVVDGGKGIRKALVDVLGDLVVIQRCQLHKLRNLRSYLPKSRAQLTKSGFVYVLSNVGTFGEGIVKIGMTRRMEPMDRVKELSDGLGSFPI